MDEALNEINNWVNLITTGSQWLWNETVGGFCARDIRTEFSDGITNASINCFNANVERVAAEKNGAHCERILKKCKYAFPSWDPEHQSFDKIRYWRGYMVNYELYDWKGLKEQGFDMLAKELLMTLKV